MRLVAWLSFIALAAALQTNLGSSSEPFQLEDQITVSEVLRRYPYLRKNMHSDNMYNLMHQLPERLRFLFKIVHIEVKGDQYWMHCYNHCGYTENVASFIAKRCRDLKDLWFITSSRDEFHYHTINVYLDELHLANKTERDELFMKYQQIMIELPAFLFSIDLNQPMERNKFLAPDHYMAAR